MVKQDEDGSNCPFLKDLVEGFNINYIQDYGDVGTAGYCQIDTSYDSTMKKYIWRKNEFSPTQR